MANSDPQSAEEALGRVQALLRERVLAEVFASDPGRQQLQSVVDAAIRDHMATIRDQIDASVNTQIAAIARKIDDQIANRISPQEIKDLKRQLTALSRGLRDHGIDGTEPQETGREESSLFGGAGQTSQSGGQGGRKRRGMSAADWAVYAIVAAVALGFLIWFILSQQPGPPSSPSSDSSISGARGETGKGGAAGQGAGQAGGGPDAQGLVQEGWALIRETSLSPSQRRPEPPTLFSLGECASAEACGFADWAGKANQAGLEAALMAAAVKANDGFECKVVASRSLNFLIDGAIGAGGSAAIEQVSQCLTNAASATEALCGPQACPPAPVPAADLKKVAAAEKAQWVKPQLEWMLQMLAHRQRKS